MIAVSYVVCLFSFKRFTAESLFKFGRIKKKKSGKATGKTPCPIHLLKLFTYSNSIQMSHVTDKPQKVSRMLLLSKFKCNVHHHRVMRKVNENTNHTWTKFNKMAQTRKMSLHM